MTGFGISRSKSTHFPPACFSLTFNNNTVRHLLQSRQTQGTNFTSSSFGWLKHSAATERVRRQFEGKWGHTKVNYNFSSQTNSWNLLNATKLIIHNLVKDPRVDFPFKSGHYCVPTTKYEAQTLWPQPDTKQITFCYGALTSLSPSTSSSTKPI